MKALFFKEHGELDVVQYGDVPDPVPGPGEVLVKVHACALNHLDIWVRRGWPGLKLPMPHWCGADVAGEVVDLGEGVTDWEKGRRVVVDPGISTVEDEFTRLGEVSVSPGYHMNKRHWNTVKIDGAVPDELIYSWIDDSYDLIVQKLPRRKRMELNKLT